MCPLPPGDYTASVHDSFSFTIDEAGWQEERQQSAEFATRIRLSRVDDPDLRLTFMSGATGPTAPVDLGAIKLAPAGFTVGQPVDVTISGTQAQSVDVLSDNAQAPANLTIDDANLSLEPDRSYRITVAKIPMGQEAATVVTVAEASDQKFAAFMPMADSVVKSVRF
jgi:hypothetical protein